jgi:hypothetical protein
MKNFMAVLLAANVADGRTTAGPLFITGHRTMHARRGIGYLRRMLPRLVLPVCLLPFPFAASAFHIHLYGLVTEHFSGAPMGGVQVRLVKDSVERETVKTGNNGRYEFYLERGYDYQVWFHREDLVTKHVHIDARSIPLFPDVPFYEMDVQMTMIAWIPGFDFTAFGGPVARASYKHSVRTLSWDVEFTDARQQELQRVMVHYERVYHALRNNTWNMGGNGRRKRKRVHF